MMRILISGLLAVFLWTQGPLPAFADDKVGVVLMHGKRGTNSGSSPIGELEEAVRDAGFLVTAPEMPWSRDRGFDKTFKAAMAEVDESVKELKEKGATKIVVGGHSIGASAAMAYGARRDGLAGVLAIAPGHSPDHKGYTRRFSEEVAKAKAMVDAGKGNEEGEFGDLNQGDVEQYSLKAKIYYDFYRPDGPMVMPVNAANIKKGTAFMWIIGGRDPAMRRNRGQEGYAFDKVPPHPKSVYKIVRGGHKATPRIGKKEIIAWLKSL